VQDSAIAGAGELVQVAIGIVTLAYLVFGISARLALTEFKVDQLWRWYVRDRKHPGGGNDAGPDPG
jgi:hypothetical protein